MQVPGGLLGFHVPGHSHSYSWYARVRDKKTNKEWTYWINGNHLNREAVAEHIRVHLPGVETISVDECHEMPTRILQPVPPSHFEYGIREGVENLLRGGDQFVKLSPGVKPIPISPI